jgi:serine protease Do
MPRHLTPGRASRGGSVRCGLVTVVCLLTLLAGTARLPAQGGDPLEAALALERRYQDIITEVEPAVVSIARINPSNQARPTENFDPFAPAQPGAVDSDHPHHPEFVPNEFGSGVIFTPQTADAVAGRLVLTAYHVVQGGQVHGERPGSGHRLVVRFVDHVSCDAAIVAADPLSDLAVLRLYTASEVEGSLFRGYPGDVGGLKSVRLDLGDETRKGSFVLVFGNPYAVARDGSASVARGMVANSHRRPAPLDATANPQERSEQTIHHFGTLLQLDARLNLGASGGAVVNLRGDLVGLTIAAAALEGYEKSAGYAIPINAGTRRIIDELAHGYEVEYGLLGVKLQTVFGKDIIRDTGYPSVIQLIGVIEGSPADRAGLQNHDRILAVNGYPVYSHYDLVREIGLLGPGNPAVLRVHRGVREITPVTVRELGKWPVVNTKDIIATRPRRGPWDIDPYRDLQVDYPTGRRQFFANQDFYPAAVIVTALAEESQTGGPQSLRVGDFITHVNDTPTPTPKEFAQAIERARGGPLRLRRIDKPEVRINNP